MMDKSNPMDWVFILLLIQAVGLKYLMAATDGTHLIANISVRGRKIALVVGMLIIWVPYLLVWGYYGHSPVDLWHGANDWWNAEYSDIVTKSAAILGWWCLVSPAHAVLAMWSIRRASQRQKNRVLSYYLPPTHSPS